MRCDLHVHTIHSGMCTVPLMNRICRECYSRPEEVYEKLKRLGMDLVTVTDHDSIDAIEELRRHADFFVSEEVTCHTPSGTEIHVGVYDINDRQHVEIQRRREDLPSLLPYLREQRLFFSVNHVFSSLTGRRTVEDYEWFEREFMAFEVRNGAMPELTNATSDRVARWMGKVGVGGSDAHALGSVGRAYTEVRGARNKEEFFAGLRAGQGTVGGKSGDYLQLTADVLQIGFEMMNETPWTRVLLPLALAVPAITAVNYLLEWEFSTRWLRKLAAARQIPIGDAAWWRLREQPETSA
ncbi:MAG: PHP domain-containing protein [Bryobacteraceae bacterium]|nr:PHP domain-containing protein [Bryobacteraceae bacterium]